MFLKSLSMKGFKSFADPTVLEFEPGITVVVGPNGSGKSNVVDAVTWVLGAQGPRALRSQKMEDVIFAGTSSRPALGRAEVSLTIDNSSGKLPVDMAEVTITRTLFRTGDSEYAINGTPCRLLDIQELLSDSGVGRQQHMIVGQGQLDAVLHARPEDRRAIIEEAAGVLKHRRRRERAERRLAATQENLERLGDLVREVRRQIRPLERQAAAARSHEALADELRAVRLYVASTELADLSRRSGATSTALERLRGEMRELETEIETLDQAATMTAADLSSRRQVDLAAILGHLEGAVERSRGMAGVLRERARGVLAALDAAADIDVVSNLESEAARIAAELTTAEEEDGGFAPLRASLAAAAADLASEEAAFEGAWGDGSERADIERHLADVRRRIDLLQGTEEQVHESLSELDRRLGIIETRRDGLRVTVAELDVKISNLVRVGEDRARIVQDAEGTTSLARNAAQKAEGAAQEAERERHRSAAKAEALARALREIEGIGGREVLADVDGFIGSIVDLVEIDAGWEMAFEAAVGAAVSAVVVDGKDAARRALARLFEQGATGAILVTGTSSDGGGRPELPSGAEPVRDHVHLRSKDAGGKDAVIDVLDSLMSRAVRVPKWEEAIELSIERPELIVVTETGDRFAESGWRIHASSGIVTAASVDEAEEKASLAARVADAAQEDWDQARVHADEARDKLAQAIREADLHEASRASIDVERGGHADEIERLTSELDAMQTTRTASEERLSLIASDVTELTSSIAPLEEDLAAAAERGRAAASARTELAQHVKEHEGRVQEMEVRTAGIAERIRVLHSRHAELERRLEGHAEQREEAAERRRRLEADGETVNRLMGVVELERDELEGALAQARIDHRHHIDAMAAGGERLEGLRVKRTETEARLTGLRERTRALDLESTEVSLRSETLVESVERELGTVAEELTDVPTPELPEGKSASEHAAALTEKLAKLGPVNPLALEELSALELRHVELDTQVNDVRNARRELQDVVRVLDQEIVDSFASAVADVNEHFSTLVAMLFPGGTGRLELTDPEDLLQTGIEVEVRPAGRNVRRVSLLSGGERSLAALAFLFAVFRSRPSPFYLMDEVEAALDDVNLSRFLGLVREFRDEAQLIVVSHQKRTMETGDALYGVTMAPGGSSQVLSQKVEAR